LSSAKQHGIASAANGDRANFIVYRILGQLRRKQKSFLDIPAWDQEMALMQDSEVPVHEYRAALVSGNGSRSSNCGLIWAG
jgi:hypothetical protein